MEYVLEREQWVPRPRSEVFPFFAAAANLERITPPFMQFKILTPEPIPMHAGTRIDYRIKLFGLPMKWKTEIEVFEPDVRFVDNQLSGPYKRWHHTHEFFDDRGGTRLTDRVIYNPGFGPFGQVARTLFIKRTLDRIFQFRREFITNMFGS